MEGACSPLLLVTFYFFFYLVPCSPIEEYNKTFPCPEQQQIYDMEHGIEDTEKKKCEQIWTHENIVIGIVGSEIQCQKLCANISDWGMSVSTCADYKFFTFCENVQNGHEIQISFHGIAVKRAQGSVGPPAARPVRWGIPCALVFIAALAGASALWWWCCCRHQNKVVSTSPSSEHERDLLPPPPQDQERAPCFSTSFTSE